MTWISPCQSRLRLTTVLISGWALLLAACSHSGTPSVTLTAIAITPATATVPVGSTQSLELIGTYSDASTAPIISGITWSSGTPAVATVSSNGIVTGVANGSDTITATADSLTATASITVGTVAPTTVIVFDDNYGAGISFQAYSGEIGTPAVDTNQHHDGTASLRIDVPATTYAGGAFKNSHQIDLSHFNALTFWAKASIAGKTFEQAGIGNDAAVTTYQAEIDSTALTTDWVQYYIPIPDPSKLTSEDGLFWFAQGSDQGAFSIWLDDVEYTTLPTSMIGAASASFTSAAPTLGTGDTYAIGGLSASIAVNGTAITVKPAPAWFDFSSSATAVATVDETGTITAVGVGTATISATLAGTAATGAISVTVVMPIVPPGAAPAPTALQANVISLLSSVYTDVPVDHFLTSWSDNGGGNVTESSIMIGNTKTLKYVYADATYAGIDFIGSSNQNEIDATSMGSFHIDIWTHDATLFKVKLVDFGANGVYDGPNSDDSEGEVAFTASSSPALSNDSWVSLDIDLSAFTGLTARGHLAQLILSASAGTVFVENIYFDTATTTPPPPPTTVPVFTDDYAPNVTFAPFGNSVNSLAVDTSTAHSGTASLKVAVPNTAYTGGALVTSAPANLSGTDSLSFWVKASEANTLANAGFANAGDGVVLYVAEVANIPVTTNWTQVIIPIPNPALLTSVPGLFYFDASSATAYTLWFDDIEFIVSGSAISAPTVSITPSTVNLTAGGAKAVIGATLGNPQVSYVINSVAQPLSTVGTGYFTYSSSDTTVATVDAAGKIAAVGTGTATISVKLGTVTATGAITVNATGSTSPGTPLSIFADAYAFGITFTGFGGSTNTESIDTSTFHSGTASLKFPVPASGYTGGALVSSTPIDLSSYDALTFWAKADSAQSLGTTGYGDDANGHITLTGVLNAQALTTSWTKFIVPLADPAKATAQIGMFFLTIGAGVAGNVWVDDIEYEKLGGAVIGTPVPALANNTLTVQVGKTVPISGTSAVFPVNGSNLTLNPVGVDFFDYTASAPNYATVGANTGVITGVAVTPTPDPTPAADLITATLQGVAATGTVGVIVDSAPAAPTTAAAAPTASASNVLSLIGNTYTAADTFSESFTDWSHNATCNDTTATTCTPQTIGGSTTYKYSFADSTAYFGMDLANDLDVSTMTHVHMDIWTSGAAPGLTFSIVDFGANGIYQGPTNDDSQGNVPVTFTSGAWTAIDLPLSSFFSAGLAADAHLAQFVFADAPGAETIYLENFYFYK